MEFTYYLLLGLMMLLEALRPGTFGRPLIVIVGTFFLSLTVYIYGVQNGLDLEAYNSMWMPGKQVWFRLGAFLLVIVLARRPLEHFVAVMFIAMATIDLLRLLDVLWAVTWWEAIFWCSIIQLLIVIGISEIHSVGRSLQAVSQRILKTFEMRVGRLGWV